MANYRTLVRHFPSAQDYLQQRKWVRRGDVLGYAPGAQTPSFSTDAFGFRHTRFEDRDIGLANVAEYDRVGLVLGSSHIFGFALSHNSETLPSQLSERFGYPFLGIAFPEADTRTLHASLLRLSGQFAKRIANVVLITGGDFTRYCYVETADPLFGPPILPVESRLKRVTEPDTEFANFLHFAFFWTKACGELAREAGINFVLADDLTFFEKSAPDATEKACELGVARSELQQKRFGTHRRHALVFQRERRRLAEACRFKLVSFPEADDLLFVDEYHYRAESQCLIAARIGEQIA
jgi:hypothetical protein